MALEDWLVKRARVSSKLHTRILLDDKMTCFQQLGSLVASGAPLLQAIQVAADQNQSKRMQAVLEDIATRVSSGVTLQQAMSGHENVFEPHWIALIGTGEVSGKMAEVLTDLNAQIRDAQETKRQISGALIYPIVLMIVAALVVVIMLGFVIPTFADMFEEMNAKLPSITLNVLAAADLVGSYGGYAFGGIIVGVFMFRRYMRTEPGKRRVKSIGLAVPMVGDLMVQSAMYRFSSNLALLLKSGVPMLEALGSLANVFRSNPAYRDAMEQAAYHLAAGRSLANSLEESGLFTNMMVNAVQIGEQSAQLGPVMDEIAPYYKEKARSFVGKVTKMLEPAIIMIMGFTIAVLMLAIYIPMFEMSGNVK